MNNRELDQLLKKNSLPEAPAGLWERFPKKVATKIHWQKLERTAESDETPKKSHGGLLAWGVCIAAASVIAAFWFGSVSEKKSITPSKQLTAIKKYLREVEAVFPNQVRAIIFDDSGPRLLLSEKADVPESLPLYVKVCGPRGCERIVTFSGQQIPVNGELCDALLDGKGNVLLVGEKNFWSEEKSRGTTTQKIEGKSLAL